MSIYLLVIRRFMMNSFMGRDYLWVKSYLMDHAQKRAGGGYTVVHDSISDFHNVLCTRMAGCSHADDLPDEVAAENGVVDQQVPCKGDTVQPMIEQADIVPMAAGWIVHNHFISFLFFFGFYYNVCPHL
jgi:hypothetical protein